MKRYSLATTCTLGAVAVALAAGPTMAFGGLAGPFKPGGTSTMIAIPSSPASGAIGPYQPGITPTTVSKPSSPASGAVGPYQPGGGPPSANYLKVEYSPQALNLGTVRAYMNEEHKAVLTLTTPTAGSVSAELQPSSAFRVTRLTSYTHTAPSPVLGGITGGQGSAVGTLPRAVVATVVGNGSLPVQADQEVEIEVALQATDSTPWQPRATLYVSGPQWSFSVAVGGAVLRTPEIDPEVQADALKIVPGGDAQLPVRLVRTLGPSFTGASGLSRTVTLTAQSLPAGVTMDPVSVPVPIDAEYVDVTLQFHASDSAPVRRDQLTRLLMDSGADRLRLDLPGHVYPKEFTWPYEQKVGDVTHRGTLTIRSDGTWHWQAHLHDDGTVIGDNYGVGVYIPLFKSAVIGGLRGDNQTVQQPLVLLPTFDAGSLGGGVLGGSQDKDIDMSSEGNEHNALGPSAALRAHYIEAVDAGLLVTGTVSTDFGPVVQWYVKTLWAAAGISLA